MRTATSSLCVLGLLSALIPVAGVVAQGPDTLWTRVYEVEVSVDCRSLLQLPDGDIVLAGKMWGQHGSLDEFFDLTHPNIDSVLYYVHEMGGYEVERGVRFLYNPFSPPDTFTVAISSIRATPQHMTRYYWTFFVPEGSAADPASPYFNPALYGTLTVQGNPYGSATVYVITADTGLVAEDYFLLAIEVMDSIRFAAADPLPALPNSISLSIYPNPFNAVTDIEFALPRQERVLLRVYDLLGREVARLAEGVMPAGAHRVRFDASDLPSGVYFAHLEDAGPARVQKMVVVK